MEKYVKKLSLLLVLVLLVTTANLYVMMTCTGCDTTFIKRGRPDAKN